MDAINYAVRQYIMLPTHKKIEFRKTLGYTEIYFADEPKYEKPFIDWIKKEGKVQEFVNHFKKQDEAPSPTSPKEEKEDEEESWNHVIASIATADIMRNVTPGDNEGLIAWKKKIYDGLKSEYTIRKKDFQPGGRNEGGVETARKIKSLRSGESEELKKIMDESISNLSEEDKKRVADYFVPSDSNMKSEPVASHSSGFGSSIEQKYYPVEFAGYWEIKTEPLYDGGKSILNAEEVGAEEAEKNANLIVKLLNDHYANT